MQCTPVTCVSTFCLAFVLTRYFFWLFCLLVCSWRPPVGNHSAVRIFPPGSGSWLFHFWQGNFSSGLGQEARSSVPWYSSAPSDRSGVVRGAQGPRVFALPGSPVRANFSARRARTASSYESSSVLSQGTRARSDPHAVPCFLSSQANLGHPVDPYRIPSDYELLVVLLRKISVPGKACLILNCSVHIKQHDIGKATLAPIVLNPKHRCLSTCSALSCRSSVLFKIVGRFFKTRSQVYSCISIV